MHTSSWSRCVRRRWSELSKTISTKALSTASPGPSCRVASSELAADRITRRSPSKRNASHAGLARADSFCSLSQRGTKPTRRCAEPPAWAGSYAISACCERACVRTKVRGERAELSISTAACNGSGSVQIPQQRCRHIMEAGACSTGNKWRPYVDQLLAIFRARVPVDVRQHEADRCASHCA
jgi:hypothetical protein